MGESNPNQEPLATLTQLCGYFLKLSATGFGGPIALAAAMERDLVQQRAWLKRSDYLDAMALAQLAPGPLAAQMAMYIGWLRGGFWGATLAGIAFVLPAFVIIVGLAALYQKFGAFTWIQGALYGIGAAVIAVIGRSAIRLARVTAQRQPLLWAMVVLTAVATLIFKAEPLSFFLGCGLVNWLWWRRNLPGAIPSHTPLLLSTLVLLGQTTAAPLWAAVSSQAGAATLGTMFLYFCKAGALVFGSGLAILPYLYHGVVEHFQWLSSRQFVDAVALGMITPGPAVISVAFIGALTAGLPGALVAALGTFLPCFLFVILPAPYFQKIKARQGVRAFITGITAAAIGTIAAAAITLGSRAIVDFTSLGIALVAFVLLTFARRLPEPIIILAAGVVGWLLAP